MSRIVTPKGRIHYPSLFEQQEYEGKSRYRCTIIFYPELFDSEDKSRWKALCSALSEKFQEKFNLPIKDAGQKYKLPIHDGTHQKGMGFGSGSKFIRMTSKNRPGVVRADLSNADPDDVYAGRWARLSGGIYTYTKGSPGMAIGLNNVQLLKNDEPFTSNTRPSEDFDAESVEFLEDDDPF